MSGEITLIDDDTVRVGQVVMALYELGFRDEIQEIISKVETLGEHSFEVDDLVLAVLACGTRGVPFQLQ